MAGCAKDDRDPCLDVAQIRSMPQGKHCSIASLAPDVIAISAIDEQRVLGLVSLLEDFFWPLIQDALLHVCGFGFDS